MKPTDKQIEEMARSICNCYYRGICKMDGNSCDLECGSAFNAYELYNAGYRKASEVEKETFDRLSNNMAKEVEGWKKHFESLYKTAKATVRAEVAREIFEEIENVINNELQNNYKVLPQFEFSNELWNKMSGRIEALKEICDFIAELKKKYTEERK